MIFKPGPLQGNYVVSLETFSDNRGWFSRYFSTEDFAEIGHSKEWVQMNHSFTIKKGTIRGMHFQTSAYKEVKLIRCVAGAIWDVAVDLRKGSPTFLQWYGAKLSAANKQMMYIPEGFAHGFQTLEDNCELLYHHTANYAREFEGGIKYDDPAVNIQWPIPLTVISERDLSHPLIDANFNGIQ